MRPKINTNYTNYISCTSRLETSEPAATVRSTGRGMAVPGGGDDERWARAQLTTPKFLNSRYLYKQTTYLSF